MKKQKLRIKLKIVVTLGAIALAALLAMPVMPVVPAQYVPPMEEPAEEPIFQDPYAVKPEVMGELKPLLGHPLIALTFDDGPNPYITVPLLDFLAQHNVLATFYVLGAEVQRHPDILRRMAAQGHQVGNHSFGHAEFTRVNADRRRREYQQGAQAIYDVLGFMPTTTRLPYGAYSATVLAEMTTPHIHWSIDPQDWRNRNANYLAQHVIDRAVDGDIILLHDVYHSTYQATRMIVPALLERGFVFVTVDQLLALRGEAQAGDVVRHRR
ncbi:MAG: polysaccharide deacetylase family protein [Oscillospiraceae bacterium]|nr:polysaccharide deacetylase family protein [Oscillospiraceae bacterium]